MLRNIAKLFNKATFANEVQKGSQSTGGSVATYKDGQLVNRTSITLKKQEDIEAYVVKTVQSYFRTTYKSGIFVNNKGVNKESILADHGLDSLDSIEISMQI